MIDVNDLLRLAATDEDPAVLVARCGRVLTIFDAQDSGNVSWIVRTDDGDLFVKTAGKPGPTPPGDPIPYLDHPDRVRLLRNAAELAQSCAHPCLAQLRQIVESPEGPLLVYERAPGEQIGTDSSRRADPKSAYQRFAKLPAHDLLTALSDLIGLHRALADEGWVACDLYDSNMIIDFATNRLTVVDLDSYHRGPSVNTMGRMFGSDRFMAPEEYQLGAPIDQRTTVYTLARIAWHFSTRLSEQPDHFCGPRDLKNVLRQALEVERSRRFSSVEQFAAAWNQAAHIDP